MDRELVLGILVVLLCGIGLLTSGWIAAGSVTAATGRHLESANWRAVCVPLLPAAMVFAALCGWAIGEPEPAEAVPTTLLLASLPLAIPLIRALLRGLHSAMAAPGALPAVTMGLLSPRIVISSKLADVLDAEALNAALEHERAHVRHRDPLRIWLAQLATDLQWPWPQARFRFRRWLQALELARDEETCAQGVEPEDLAAAILAGTRLARENSQVAAATLTGEEQFLKDRVSRLLDDRWELGERSVKEPRRLLVPFVVAALFCFLVLGRYLGEPVVRTLLRFS